MALKLLAGMKVIEIAAFMAAPMGGRILGEWGADVIKVEPPTGDSNRGIGLARHIYNGDQAGWDSINSCKRCITLDTRKPEGLAILKEDVYKRQFHKRHSFLSRKQGRRRGKPADVQMLAIANFKK